MSFKEERATPVDRLLASIVFTLSVVFTVLIVPLILSFGGPEPFGIYYYYSHWFFKFLVVLTFITGVILHPKSVFTLLGHLWCTEKPQNIKLTLLLWLILINIGILSYYFSDS